MKGESAKVRDWEAELRGCMEVLDESKTKGEGKGAGGSPCDLVGEMENYEASESVKREKWKVDSIPLQAGIA